MFKRKRGNSATGSLKATTFSDSSATIYVNGGMGTSQVGVKFNLALIQTLFDQGIIDKALFIENYLKYTQKELDHYNVIEHEETITLLKRIFKEVENSDKLILEIKEPQTIVKLKEDIRD